MNQKDFTVEDREESQATVDIRPDQEKEEYNHNVLAMYVDLDLPKVKYKNLRDHNENLFGKKLYPTYLEIAEMKNIVTCQPSRPAKSRFLDRSEEHTSELQSHA